MRIATLAVALLAIGFVAGTDPAWADGIRCGNDLILKGDTRERVRARCGEPAEISKQTIFRSSRTALRGRIEQSAEEIVEIPVEIWTYNFGRNRLMERVRFVDGVVEKIETLGYGYDSQERSR